MQYSPTQLKLIELLGSRELTELKSFHVIRHEPTIADFHKWLNKDVYEWSQIYYMDGRGRWIEFQKGTNPAEKEEIQYDSSKSLLEQSTETQENIIQLITKHS